MSDTPRPAGEPPARRAGARRRLPLDLAIRVALVLALLGLAANTLSSRRGLDWDVISEPPESGLAGLVLIGLGTFAVVVATRTVLGLVRAAPPAEGDIGGVPGRRLPLLAYVTGVLVIGLTLLLVYLVLASALAVPARLRDQAGRPTGLPANPAGRAFGGNDTRALVLTVVVAAALGLVVSSVLRRGRGATGDDLADGEPSDDLDDRAALSEAVTAAGEELDSHGDDTRAAIIAAYLAMERQLVTSGARRRPSDTPTDFLERAAPSLRVSRPAVGRLTELFREARFSTHPMPPGARADAARALARLAEDLSDAAQ